MKKISDYEYEKYIKEVLLSEKDKNIYILGDIQQYGLQNEMVDCFVEGDLQKPKCIIMRFGNSYVIYSPYNDFDVEIIRKFYVGKNIHCISGKQETIYKINLLWNDSYIIDNRMLKIDRSTLLNTSVDKSLTLKKLTISELTTIQKFYLSIDEFAKRYSGREGLRRIEEQIRTGKIYALYNNGEIVSVACLSAETKEFAMIDNVATKKEFRGKRYGQKLVKRLCIEEFESGKEFLCVYCNSTVAEQMYKKVGCEEIGVYSLLYFK